MYTENNKGFTIITNFGCDNHCKYCISKQHPILQNKQTDIECIDWNFLEQCISESNAPTINLSGGGDPFYNWNEHREFYFRIYDIATKYGKQMDIHTRILPEDIELIKLFRKIALSVEYYDEEAMKYLAEVYPRIKEIVKIRVIQVVDSKITKVQCQTYIKKLKEIGIPQITFRQMFGNKEAYKHFNELKNEIKEEGVLFLKDGEYHNYYFTTTNKLYPFFFGYSEEDRMKWMAYYENIEQSCN
ncbi:hypothetical protein [Enterocloster citroniae]